MRKTQQEEISFFVITFSFKVAFHYSIPSLHFRVFTTHWNGSSRRSTKSGKGSWSWGTNCVSINRILIPIPEPIFNNRDLMILEYRPRLPVQWMAHLQITHLPIALLITGRKLRNCRRRITLATQSTSDRLRQPLLSLPRGTPNRQRSITTYHRVRRQRKFLPKSRLSATRTCSRGLSQRRNCSSRRVAHTGVSCNGL